MTAVMKSPWLAAAIGTALYLGVTWHFLSANLPDLRTAPPAPVIETTSDPCELSVNQQELELLVQELKQEKELLAARAAELQELDLRLQADRQELSNVTATIQKMQKDFDQQVTRVREEESANLKKLAKTYAVMSPESAATVFQELDDAAVVKIMMFMKEAETAPILEQITRKGETEARRVANLTERLRLTLTDKPKTGRK